MKVVCFGEIMLRLSPEGSQRLQQAQKFDAFYGGAEANAAVSLAQFGDSAAYVTALPENGIAQCAVNSLRQFGVDTAGILRQGPRMGLYYCEKGASQRGTRVIYDRAGSSFALSKPEDYHWQEILKGADWFHFTGITPALGGEMPQICMDALKMCHQMGVTVSCDLNYRGKLWSLEKAAAVMAPMMPYVNVCIANEEDDIFGLLPANGASQKPDHAGYIAFAEELTGRFGFDAVGVSISGNDSASDNHWSGMFYRNGNACFAGEYLIHLVDRVGCGDAFGAALIHAMGKWPDEPQKIIDFAAAASCIKQTVMGDCNLTDEKEVCALMKSRGSGKVQR